MKKHLPVCLVILVVALFSSEAYAQQYVRLFFLSGQSNMGGSKPVSRTTPAGDGNFWIRTSGWPNPDDYVPGIIPELDTWYALETTHGNGREMAFAQKMQELYPGDIIALVKSSHAAVGINHWDEDSYSWEFMTTRMAAAAADLNQRVAAGTISGWQWSGFVFMQGENNAAYGAALHRAQKYARDLETLIENVRSHTGVPDLPAVVGRIYKYNNRAHMDEEMWPKLRLVRGAEERAYLDYNNAAWISTDDLPANDDDAHYSDYSEMGHRFGRAMTNLINGERLPFRPYRVNIVWTLNCCTPIDDVDAIEDGHEYSIEDDTPLHAEPGDGQVSIDWDYAYYADYYSVHYGTSPDNLGQTVTDITTNQVSISGLDNGVTYYFSAQSHNEQGDSDVTDIVSATPEASPNTAPWVWLQDLKKYPEYEEYLYLGESLRLDATVRDNDLSSATYLWEQVSGPGTVIFATPADMDTWVDFSAAGTYVVKFTADDGALASSRELTVHVLGNNEPPVVELGPGLSRSIGAPMLLSYYYYDDMHPYNQPRARVWEQVSGPGEVTFIPDPGNNYKTAMMFSAVGEYVVQLSVSDGEKTGTGQTHIFVHEQDQVNLALNKPASQSSNSVWYKEANYAVDGKILADGINAYLGSYSSTSNELHAWWEVDLQGIHELTNVKLFTKKAGEPLDDFYVFVSDLPFSSDDPAVLLEDDGVWSYHDPGLTGFPLVIALNRSGRYVRIQLAGSNRLVLNEVEVYGLVTCDGVVDQADAVAALQTVAGAGDELPACAYAGADADGDERAGLAEAIRALGVAGQ